MNVDVWLSDVYKKHEAARAQNFRVIIHEGSARSTKTYSLLQNAILIARAQKKRITISRKKLTWLRQTLLIDFKDIMESWYMWDEKHFKKTEFTYHFQDAGQISFVGLDEPSRLHGRKQHIFYGNEFVENEEESFKQASIRTMDEIWLDYNPKFEQHWIYDNVETRQDSINIHSTYLDNKMLTKEIIQEIEQLRPVYDDKGRLIRGDEVSWKVYGLGLRAAHKSLIFPNWEMCDDIPEDAKYIMTGLDFGYTNDPTAIVDIYQYEGDIYLKERLYKTGLINVKNPKYPEVPSIEEELNRLGYTQDHLIIADSAEKKSITELRLAGFNVRPSKKIEIVKGIDMMKKWKIFYTADSMNLIKEKNNYKYKESTMVEGTYKNEPIDLWNHLIDAIRYVIVMKGVLW